MIRAMPERKRFFFIEVLPYCDMCRWGGKHLRHTNPMKASLNNNGDDFPAHENWMRFETTADLAVKYSEHVLAILENWSLGVRAGHHWVSQDGGSLTNCLLMVATVSAGERGGEWPEAE